MPRPTCFRIDYNIRIGEGGDAQRGGYTENVLWRYYDALYRIFDNVRERYPHLLLETVHRAAAGRTWGSCRDSIGRK